MQQKSILRLSKTFFRMLLKNGAEFLGLRPRNLPPMPKFQGAGLPNTCHIGGQCSLAPPLIFAPAPTRHGDSAGNREGGRKTIKNPGRIGLTIPLDWIRSFKQFFLSGSKRMWIFSSSDSYCIFSKIRSDVRL